jgi:hypothetical protein
MARPVGPKHIVGPARGRKTWPDSLAGLGLGKKTCNFRTARPNGPKARPKTASMGWAWVENFGPTVRPGRAWAGIFCIGLFPGLARPGPARENAQACTTASYLDSRYVLKKTRSNFKGIKNNYTLASCNRRITSAKKWKYHNGLYPHILKIKNIFCQQYNTCRS